MQSSQQRPEKTRPRQGRIGNRPFSVLILSILVRAIHQIGAAVYLSAFLLDFSLPQPYFYIAVLSGFILVFTEWLRHRQLLREVAGMSTLVKLILLGLAFHHIVPADPAVIAAFLIAAVGAHAPKDYRHRLLF